MKLLQILRESFLNVMRNKLRTALTMLGLVIGIASVIILVGIGDGSNHQVSQKIKSLGGDVISAYAYNGSNMTYRDIEGIRSLDSVGAAAPSKSLSANVSSNHRKLGQTSLTASDENYLEARNLKLLSGRNLSIADRVNKSKVCVVGEKVAREVSRGGEALGTRLKIDGDIFTIVGVVKSQGESMGLNTDDLVTIPLTTADDMGYGSDFNKAYVKAADADSVNAAKKDTESFLANEAHLKPSSFVVNTQSELLNAGASVNQTMSALLGGIASISLIVAGVGVMNVMLVSVTERIREIGIKKALGARKIDIMGQFLCEALIISALGGAAGIAGGLALGYAVGSAGLAFEPSAGIVGIAAVTSIAIGLIFGLLPSYRAASLNPIEALK